MDRVEVRMHIKSIVELLSEILAEVKALRKDYAEGQVVVCEMDAAEQIDFDELLRDSFQPSYER